MAKARAGRTVKVSVSVDREDLRVLRRRAKEAFGGNLSAVLAESARRLRQQEARDRVIERLGGPTIDADVAAAIDAEQAGGSRYEPRKVKRRGRAA